MIIATLTIEDREQKYLVQIEDTGILSLRQLVRVAGATFSNTMPQGSSLTAGPQLKIGDFTLTVERP
jgi:hypothetical protein